jgi:hypothetical protein
MIRLMIQLHEKAKAGYLAAEHLSAVGYAAAEYYGAAHVIVLAAAFILLVTLTVVAAGALVERIAL